VHARKHEKLELITMNASTNLLVFKDHNKCLEEGTTSTRGLRGNNFGNKVAHNKFWEGWKHGITL
jgi:hypothetical protein